MSTHLYLALVLMFVSYSAADDLRTADKSKWIAPLFISSSEVVSFLNIRNVDDYTVELIASFDSLEGEEVGRRLLELSPHSTATVDVASVEMIGHRFADLGSITIDATTVRTTKINGWLTISSRDRHLFLEEPLQIVDDKPRFFQRAFVTSTWSVPVLAIHSLGKVSQSVSIECLDGEGHRYQSQVDLPAGMTFLVNACINGRNESRTYEEVLRGNVYSPKGSISIEVRTETPGGNVAAWGFVDLNNKLHSTPQIAGIEFVQSDAGIKFSQPN